MRRERYENAARAEITAKTGYAYSEMLKRHLGADEAGAPVLEGWERLGNSSRVKLRAALRRAGHPTLADQVPPTAVSRHDVVIPDEGELKAIEKRASKADSPKGELILILLKVGLRAFELLSLERGDVETAVKSGLLSVTRKRSYKTQVAVKHVVPLFEVLLETPARTGPGRAKGQEWRLLSELVTRRPGEHDAHFSAAYQTLRNWAREIATGHAPHWLRHAFATRLMRRGAPLSVAQRALGHASPSTTLRYQHSTPEDVLDYVE